MKKKINTHRAFSTLTSPSETMHSTMYETKRSFRKSLDSLRNVNVKQKIQKALVTGSDFAKHYAVKTSEDLREFEKMQGKIKDDYIEIHDDNQHFSKYYKKIEELRELSDKKKKYEKVNRIETTFNDLINKYRERGYKIPDMSVKNNLFEPSPLLMENPKINDYYKFLSLQEIEKNKDQFFLDKLLNQVTERQFGGESIDEGSKTPYDRRTTMAFARKLSVFKNLLTLQTEDYSSENRHLVKENARKRALTNEYSHKVQKVERLLTSNSIMTGTRTLMKKVSSKIIPPLNINNLASTLSLIKNDSSRKGDSNRKIDENSRYEANNNNHSNTKKDSNKNLCSSRNKKNPTQLPSELNHSLFNRSNKSRNVDNIIRRSIFKLNDDKTPLKTRTAEKMSNLETAGNTDRSKHGSSINFKTKQRIDFTKNNKLTFHNKTLSNHSFKSMKTSSCVNELTDTNKKISHSNFETQVNSSPHFNLKFKSNLSSSIKLTEKDIQQFQTMPNFGDFSIENKDSCMNLNLNDNFNLNTEKMLKELYDNKKKFLDYIVENMEIDKMTVGDLKDVIIDYCVTFLGYKDREAEEAFGNKIDPSMIYSSIAELKNKIEELDVKEKFTRMYNFGEFERKNKLEKIKELDKEAKNLKYILVKKINTVQSKDL